MRTRFFVVGLLTALLLASVGSYYASAHPDGLEYVAEQTGFIDSAEDPKTGDSPFADYQTSGVEDERLSGGLAGVVGVLLVLVIAGGVAYAVRRRTPADSAG
ncbi:PDGLE domain-containing protein [Nocardioides sp. cx-169]|uniref:PDGLE domain-containing protein n=1 Tax=Nocardioides sp. cx-169 TaxID=2899080 RepID=UPI001E380665|nr:PDGLE domain-containing protein [Nocardioides sp. cx-169]MCD4534008.1 PDGLE domain-containing protein [Nocardioides sp. cx-169]